MSGSRFGVSRRTTRNLEPLTRNPQQRLCQARRPALAFARNLRRCIGPDRDAGLFQKCSGFRIAVGHESLARRYADQPYYGEAAFTAQMEMLRSEFRILSSEELLWHYRGQTRFPPRSVLITFDDGYENNYRTVLPVVERLDLRWVLFRTTQSLDEPDTPLWFVALRAVCLFSDGAAFPL